MKITIDDLLEEQKKSIYELILDARNEATRKGIKANSIVINRGLVHIPEEPGVYPEMICGLKCYLTSSELPEDYAFAVCHNPNSEPKSEWIPVTERLPEEEGWYLVYTTPNREHKSINKAKFCKGFEWNNFKPEWHGAGGRWENVTHWMPLTEPPKE